MATLREIQAPLKAQYQADEGSSRITLRARGDAGDGAMSCSVDIGRAIYAAEAHPGVGGAGMAACSGDLLLGALAACAQLTCQMVAANMGLSVQVAVEVEGDLDLRGTLGLGEAPVGFTAIRTNFSLSSLGEEIATDRMARLQERTERYCVVLQTLGQPASLTSSWQVRGLPG